LGIRVDGVDVEKDGCDVCDLTAAGAEAKVGPGEIHTEIE
jgi:hypothetical protein